MSTYIFQLRRGIKDDDTGRDDWAQYEARLDHLKPIAGELVLEYDNGIPRLKIGDGEREFSELPYMSVDSFILPKQEYVSLSTEWIEDGDKRYYQDVDVVGATVTSNSKVDLQPTVEQLSIFRNKDLTFVAENTGGIVRVYCIGQVPQNAYAKIPVTVTEIVTNETTIIGNTTATPYPQPDWNQNDATKADYIKNKPSSMTSAKIHTVYFSNFDDKYDDYGWFKVRIQYRSDSDDVANDMTTIASQLYEAGYTSKSNAAAVISSATNGYVASELMYVYSSDGTKIYSVTTSNSTHEMIASNTGIRHIVTIN